MAHALSSPNALFLYGRNMLDLRPSQRNEHLHPPRCHYNRLARRMGHLPWPSVLYRIVQVTRYQADLEMQDKAFSLACEDLM
jgi:hypothetical protein